MSQGSLENNRNHCNSTKVRMKNKTTCGKKTSDVELLTFALRLAPSRVDFLKHFFYINTSFCFGRVCLENLDLKDRSALFHKYF